MNPLDQETHRQLQIERRRRNMENHYRKQRERRRQMVDRTRIW